MTFQGARVLVLGLKVSGTEVARVLAKRGASVLASDAGASPVEIPGVDVELGSHDRAQAELPSFDFVFASPGISPLRGFLAEVIASGVPVVSELDLAQQLTSSPVVAVTGTNGKTTVCRLAERMGREADLEVYACGNLETKFITAADEHPDADAFVVEASSFSLAFCGSFAPRVAIVTSLAPDHLDWHGTFDHYRDSKAKIAAQQSVSDLYLYPASQPELRDLAPDPGPQRVPFGSVVGSGAGAWVDGDEVIVSLPSISMISGGAGLLSARGSHFGADTAAAAAAMATIGADADSIGRAMSSFSFDAHRLEPVGAMDGVRFVDDSVATNTHATVAAIRSFGSSPVVLIAGGRNKGIDLAPLRNETGRLRAVVGLGEAATDVERVFEGSGMFVGIAASMREAVAMANDHAQAGDVVLLSPACASHDMYDNYAQRGDDFAACCRDLGVLPGGSA